MRRRARERVELVECRRLYGPYTRYNTSDYIIGRNRHVKAHMMSLGSRQGCARQIPQDEFAVLTDTSKSNSSIIALPRIPSDTSHERRMSLTACYESLFQWGVYCAEVILSASLRGSNSVRITGETIRNLDLPLRIGHQDSKTHSATNRNSQRTSPAIFSSNQDQQRAPDLLGGENKHTSQYPCQ